MTVATLADAVAEALELLPAQVRGRFAVQPVETMRADLGLTVSAVDHLSTSRAEGGACDGVSFLQDNVVLYAATGPSNPRENFTLGHELGHWLVDQAGDIYDWLLDQPDPPKLLETMCDHIAAQLLLPPGALDAVVGSGPIRAQHVIDLAGSTRVSRPVAAIALARRLPSMGAAAIIDRATGAILTASIRPDPDQGWPRVHPWPGQQLPESDPLRRLTSGQRMTTRRLWRTSWGTTEDFYIDAVADHSRIVVLFSCADVWKVEAFHAPDTREYDDRPQLSGTCCGQLFDRRGYPCGTCGAPYCPACGLCRCQKRDVQDPTCRSCNLKVLPHRLSDGVCDDCA